MILKRPYAFFIRYFKFLHLIIFMISAILLYRTTLIYDFMKEFNKTSPNVIGNELTSSLFSPLLYLLIAILIIVNILIIIIMIRKDKPYLYYIINIILYVSVLLTYLISNSTISDMEKMLVAAKTTLAVRDITNLARLFQTISVVFYLIRATGFDIKKFDFVRDLKYLDITVEDSEEIEVSLEFEGNVFRRNIRKYIRNAKYYYKENKFILNIVIMLFISAIFFIIYLNTNKYNRSYKENDFFNARGISIGVKESYILTKNYKNISLSSEDYALVVLKIASKSDNAQEIPLARAALLVNGKQYYSIRGYQGDLLDLGNVYTNQSLNKEFTDYLLIYKIPKTDINSKMQFRYIDNMEYKRGRTIVNSMDVKLNPSNLDDTQEIVKTYNINEEMQMKNYKVLINNYEIQDRFTNIYSSCISANECYDYKEILKPSVGEKEKVILKIDGTLEVEKNIQNINNIYSLISQFGTIEYTYNGKNYKETNDFKQIIPTRTNQKNVYYIEVNKEILDSTEIKLSFNQRNEKHEYILRGNISE